MPPLPFKGQTAVYEGMIPIAASLRCSAVRATKTRAARVEGSRSREFRT